MIDNRTVGRTIAALRQNKGMTQQQLAAAMNVSHQAVSKWENGAALPDIQTLVELTQLFGISVEQLLNGEIPGTEEESRPQSFGSFVGSVLDDLGSVFKGAQKTENPTVEETDEPNKKKVSLQEILQMAPFMSKGAVAEMIGNCEQKLTPSDIARIAPFVDSAYLEKLIAESDTEISWDTLRRVAPFLKKEMVDAFARAIALGEKYVRPAAQDMNSTVEEVCRTLDDVSRKIGKGVDKAVRKVVRFGESVANEMSKAFDDLSGEACDRENRLEQIRRTAFERALESEKWDWIEAHIAEIHDEELLRRIARRANELGMQEWLGRNLGSYADESAVDKAVADGDWDWLGDNAWRQEVSVQERIARAAVSAGKWDWLSAYAGQMELDGCAAEIVTAARRGDGRDLAVQLARSATEPGQIECCCAEALEDEDYEFCAMIADILPEGMPANICAKLAQNEDWERVKLFTPRLELLDLIALMEIAVQNGNFDAIDMLDELVRSEREEEKKR